MTKHHWQCDWHLDQGPECNCGLTGPRAWIMDWLPADRAPTAAEVIAMDVEVERLKAEGGGDSMSAPPPVRQDAGEHVRMADEAARDVWREVMAMLPIAARKPRRCFGVQHVDGRIVVTVEVLP